MMELLSAQFGRRLCSKSEAMQTTSSPDEFWSAIERNHGGVPKLVKLVLRINGFDSFLALKGFRYDEKEFFASLEQTVKEFLESDFENSEKQDLSTELAAQYQSASNFRIKPGHRSYIMNLMLEIEKTETTEFFQKSSDEDTNALPQEESYIKSVEPSYSRDQEGKDDQVEYEYEEYLSNDSSIDSTGIIAIEFSSPKQPRESTSTQRAEKRRPEQMYNHEFMAKCVNPRRRRVATNKIYPNTDEGTRERFRDLLFQSMECILPRERMPAIETGDIQVEKSEESDYTWIVYCPICSNRIRLAVVYENLGRYCNYKRSNFERHLRFKHCKGVNQGSLKQSVVTE